MTPGELIGHRRESTERLAELYSKTWGQLLHILRLQFHSQSELLSDLGLDVFLKYLQGGLRAEIFSLVGDMGHTK